jgi:molecular chaperone GrpE
MTNTQQDEGRAATSRESLVESPGSASASDERTSALYEERVPASVGARADDAETLRQQRDEFYDLLLRKTAEFDNFRKRVERERREQAELAAADLIKDLLPLVDDLERALKAEATETGAQAYRRGVELIHKQLIAALSRRGVTPIDPLGAEFDPHWHEAVVRERAEGRRDGEVLEVFSRGYKLGDRLLRPAMVKVASA